MFDPDADEDVAALGESWPEPVPAPDALIPYFAPLPWIMGILNVTPDSFSDGGRWDATDAAVARGLQLVADGAHLVDVGGESTRPGAHRVTEAQEIARVVPVITELARAGVQCSVDTTRSGVAEAALTAGAVLVNDVSGGLADPDMVRVVAERGCPWILMHWRGHSDTMNTLARYDDVVADVLDELTRQVEVALAAGVGEHSLILDPGLGFAKNADHNWDLLEQLDRCVDLGLPVLVGTSRKRFLGQLLADREPAQDTELDLHLSRPFHDPGGNPRPPSGRDIATAATSVVAARAGAWAVRVHEPRPTADVLAVEGALIERRNRRQMRQLLDWLPPLTPDRPLASHRLLDQIEVGVGRPSYRVGHYAAPVRGGSAFSAPVRPAARATGGDEPAPRRGRQRSATRGRSVPTPPPRRSSSKEPTDG